MKKRISGISLLLFMLVCRTSFGQLAATKYNQKDLLNDRFFQEYYNHFKSLVEKNKSLELAKMFEDSYPLVFLVDDAKGKMIEINIKNKQDFITFFPKAFSRRMLNFIKQSTYTDFEIMEGGLKLPGERVWFNYDVKRRVIKLSHVYNTRNI